MVDKMILVVDCAILLLLIFWCRRDLARDREKE